LLKSPPWTDLECRLKLQCECNVVIALVKGILVTTMIPFRRNAI
jgi:hypothetical protein